MSPRTQSLAVILPLGGQDYRFRLHTRPLRLGDYGTVQYYWMDSSELRDVHRSEAGLANFRYIVGFWYRGMQRKGCAQELDQEVHLLLASCYALLSKHKAVQQVFRDAHLRPNTFKSEIPSLPDDLQARVQDAVQSRDRLLVQRELDLALDRFRPPERVLPLLQEAFTNWVGKGVGLFRRKGLDGLEEYLREVDYWLSRFRKRSGIWVRHFLNFFAYECKAAFYTCYANAWSWLVPWLIEHRNLDPLSERLLRFWHHQQQPIEIPHGRTAGGIYYPTKHGVTVRERAPDGRWQEKTLIRQTERIGPTHIPDCFSGQILSLHPLSAFFMKDPALCAIAGRFFASDGYDKVMRHDQGKSCPEYWDLVGAILTAAYQYRQTLDQQNQVRGKRQRAVSEELVSAPSEEVDAKSMLEDYARARQIGCAACGGKLLFRDFQPAQPAEKAFTVEFSCSACKSVCHLSFDQADFSAWLRDLA